MICLGLETGSLIPQLTVAGSNSLAIALLCLIVAILNVWLFTLIWRNKSLQVHPMRLFMYIAIADSIYYSNQFFTYAICRMKLP